ncbi:hypothetical protein ACWD25_42665, partial [Streptomyces sp. NPDC002920]
MTERPAQRTPNRQLAALIAEAGFSNAGLARRVDQLGLEHGLDLRYDKTSVTRWLRGQQPRGTTPALIAEVFTRRLGRRLTAQDLGLDACAPVYAGLEFAGTPEEAIDIVGGLWRKDSGSHAELRKIAFTPAGLVVPSRDWLIGRADDKVARTDPTPRVPVQGRPPAKPGAGAAGHSGAGPAAFPGGGSTAFPGAGPGAHPGAGPAAHPGTGPAAHPGAGSAAFPGGGSAGHSGAGSAAFPGAGSAGHSGAGSAAFPGAGSAGHSGAGSAAYPGAGSAAHPGAGPGGASHRSVSGTAGGVPRQRGQRGQGGHGGSERGVGQRVTGGDIAALRSVGELFRTLDDMYGGGHARQALVRYLEHECEPMLRGTYGEQTGRRLFGAAADLTRLAGWTSFDIAAHGLAQRYFVQALRLAAARRITVGQASLRRGRQRKNQGRDRRLREGR